MHEVIRRDLAVRHLVDVDQFLPGREYLSATPPGDGRVRDAQPSCDIGECQTPLDNPFREFHRAECAPHAD